MTFKFISPVPLFFSFLLYWDVATRKLNNDACGSARGRLGSGLQSSGFGRAASARELLPETPWGSQRQPLSMRFGVCASVTCRRKRCRGRKAQLPPAPRLQGSSLVLRGDACLLHALPSTRAAWTSAWTHVDCLSVCAAGAPVTGAGASPARTETPGTFWAQGHHFLTRRRRAHPTAEFPAMPLEALQ